MNLDPSQIAAIEFATHIMRRCCIITGGAGTGKTTIIREIVERLGSVIVMAPTGKAAARLKDATGLPATTIHHALKYDGEKFNRAANFDYPVIIDESSMLDSFLLRSILELNPPRLILVGDEAQLPPVGKGQPFHDLVALRPDMVHNLTFCHRASGAVHKAAQAIRNGKAPAQKNQSGGETWQVLETGGPESTAKKLQEIIGNGYFDSRKDIIIACRNGDDEKSDGGIEHINQAVKALVNPGDKMIRGDRVIICKNYPVDDLWNGDTGTIVEVDYDGQLFVALDRDPANDRMLTKEQMKQVKLSYCLTIHKAQGSQFRRIFILLFNSDFHMLSRSLIYTAVTRCANPGGVLVMGESKAFYAGINSVLSKQTVLQRLSK